MTLLRSFLFIPGDNENKIAKADGCGADAVIFDLEDAVAPDNKPRARELTAAHLAARPRGNRNGQIWVRVNPFDSGLTLTDLAAVASLSPDGIMLPKISGVAEVVQLGHYLDALEAQAGLAPGMIGIIPVATETAAAPFHLGEFAQTHLPRLVALTWGAEDLAAAVGASTNRAPNGEWAFTYQLARSLTLLAAHSAGVQAIDTLHSDFRDIAGLRMSSRASRAEGFSGRLAIHPAQVDPINTCYLPSHDEIAHARRVLEAFAANPGAGTVGLDGQMIDIPHKKQAELVLRQAGEPTA
jgi:citrate lyase subunit beta / citryl-CoA lyase